MSNDCVTNYVYQNRQCPRHPVESALFLKVMEEIVRDATVKALTKLAREFLDDELILSEETLDV